jgi:methylenetetrahydrofolate dehydrogenase (NADP+)/methenyltetrahydrofolate cyclohydrolase
MTAEIIDCERIARGLRGGIETELARLRNAEITVGLATLVVGDELVAVAEQRRLERVAAELGIAFESVRIPGSPPGAEVVETVRALNDDHTITAIVPMRPLPSRLDKLVALGAIDTHKDADAANPENVGLLTLGQPRRVPSKAAAIFEILDAWVSNAERDRRDFYRRSRIVVLAGEGDVGPAALLLGWARRAPVALVDPFASGGDRLGWYTRHADVLIAAADLPGLIRAEHVRRGAIVVDAGRTLVPDGNTGELRVLGDVAIDQVHARARAVTPVPNGVAMVSDMILMREVVRAAATARDRAIVLQGLS